MGGTLALDQVTFGSDRAVAGNGGDGQSVAGGNGGDASGGGLSINNAAVTAFDTTLTQPTTCRPATPASP